MSGQTKREAYTKNLREIMEGGKKPSIEGINNPCQIKQFCVTK